MKLTVQSNTVFKAEPRQSTELPDDQKRGVSAGEVFEIASHQIAPSSHVRVKIPDGRNAGTWYLFTGHVLIEGNEPNNNPQDKPIEKTMTGPFKLPDYKSTFFLSEPILRGGNFTWAEATKNGTRIPANKRVVEGILKIADVMQDVRMSLGDRPITVTSWYRDPVTNSRVGGSRRSRHMVGDAVDFQVSGISPFEVSRRLDGWWGSRGGLASASSFTHIDARGYKARWRY